MIAVCTCLQTRGLISRDKDNVDYSSSDDDTSMVVSYKSTQSAVSHVSDYRDMSLLHMLWYSVSM